MFRTCFWPPESSEVFASNQSPIPNTVATSATRRRMASGGMPTFSKPKASSRQTVSHTIWLSGSWKT